MPGNAVRSPEYNVLSRYFDLLNEKYVPYEGQCDFAEGAFKKYGKDVRRILDLACGTGIHAFSLARRGYHVTGIDLSPEMLAVAQGKLDASPGLDVNLQRGDMRRMSFNAEYDTAIAFNYPVAYCLSHLEIESAFRSVSRALRPGGLFIFDIMSNYNPRPSPQREGAESEAVLIDCLREFALDHLRQVLVESNVYYVTQKGTGEIQRIDGYDEFRVYYPQEIRYYLENMGGFRVLGFHNRWDLESESNRSDMVVIAEKGG
jgi:SAM-dependent methyltransferase